MLRVIHQKLDHAALEMMCASYSRNLKLRLSPADVHFLQPSPQAPSEVLSLVPPQWFPNPHVLFFYLLQVMSLNFQRPQFTFESGANDPKQQQQSVRTKLVAYPELQDALRSGGLPEDVEIDHLFLYIRPHTRGRGK